MPVILVGVIGGTIAYGISGLFLGPIILSVAWALLVHWVEERNPASTAALPPDTPAPISQGEDRARATVVGALHPDSPEAVQSLKALDQ